MLKALAYLEQFNLVFLILGGVLTLTGLALKLWKKRNGTKNTPDSTQNTPHSQKYSQQNISDARSLFDKIKYDDN